MEDKKDSCMNQFSSKKDDVGGEFHCHMCNLKEKYGYFGKTPKFASSYVFLEAAYLMKDPFSSPSRNSFLLLGSDCSICGKMVCQGQECSLFFCKRFCLKCARQRLLDFPSEIQQEIIKWSKSTD